MSNIILEVSIDFFSYPIQIYYSKDWSSVSSEYRIKIRKHIKENFSQNLESHILDLESLPSHRDKTISISHCKEMGGYAIAEKYSGLGFDLESSDRVRKKTIEKISNESEMKGIDNYAFLWCAKEACYKALGKENQKGKKYSSIVISKWTYCYSTGYNLFEAHCDKSQFSGVVLTFESRQPVVSCALVVKY